MSTLSSKVQEIFNEPGCDKNLGKSEKERKKGCTKQLQPGAAAGGCAFDGAKIALQPITDVAHLVHGPIACEGNSWDNRHAASSGSKLYRTGFTTDISELDVVYGAEKDLYREQRQAATLQTRALKALTRGIVDSLAPIDSLRRSSPGIGRYYCEATAALTAFFSRRDTTTKSRGTATSEPLAVSPTIAPVVTPDAGRSTTVQAGVKAVADSVAVSAASAAPPTTPATTTQAEKPPTVSPTVTPSTNTLPIRTPTPVPAASIVPAPTVAPGATQTPTVAPSAGVTVEDHQSLLPSATVTPSMASTGLGSILEQTIQRASIARSTWSQYEVEIHKKFSLAVACIVFVLLGAPIALRFPRGGVGLVIGASLGVFALYYVCLIAGESMADDGVLPPWVAMWGANLVFTLVGVILFLRMGREGSTARGGDLDDVKDRLVAWVASLRPSARRSAPVPVTDG